MKRILLPVFLVLILSSSGCLLFGWYANGDPNRSTTTEMEDWTKSNIDQVQRKEDWISCGGTSAGWIKFSPVTHAGSLTAQDGIEDNKAIDNAQACMVSRGYHYTGKCRGERSRRFACRRTSWHKD